MAGGNRIVATHIPVNERTYITGYSELMGYLNIKSREKLIKDYINEGLLPIVWKGTNRWNRLQVDKWIEDHDETQHVQVRTRK